MSDQKPVRNQASLTTSSGRSWLIVGALFTVICGSVLIMLNANPPRGLGLGATVAIVLIYLGMIVVRVNVPATRLRLRLGIMAAGLLSIAAVALVSALVIAWATAAELG